jgi:hypothetical protein
VSEIRTRSSREAPASVDADALANVRGFRLLLSESSVDPAYDPYAVLPHEEGREATTSTCDTLGQLIRCNFLYLLDRGELGTLRNLLEQCAEEYAELAFPPAVD